MLRTLVGLLICQLLVASPARAGDTPFPSNLWLVETMLTNLGHPAAYDGTHPQLTFVIKSLFSYTMVVSIKGPLVFIRVNLQELAPNLLTKLDSEQPMKDSDVDNFYYAVTPDKANDGDQFVTANFIIPLPDLTAKLLSSELKEMVANMDATANLWDADLWN